MIAERASGEPVGFDDRPEQGMGIEEQFHAPSNSSSVIAKLSAKLTLAFPARVPSWRGWLAGS